MTSCVFYFYRNEPSGAAAASALGDSEVGTLDAGEVPIAVVNAAARHVKKGLFSLPFRKTTRAMQRLKPKKNRFVEAARSVSFNSRIGNCMT